MIKNIRPVDAAIMGAVLLAVVLIFALQPMPEILFLGVAFGVSLGKIVIGAALVAGTAFGLYLARKDTAVRRAS
jgi:hypothetical protein